MRIWLVKFYTFCRTGRILIPSLFPALLGRLCNFSLQVSFLAHTRSLRERPFLRTSPSRNPSHPNSIRRRRRRIHRLTWSNIRPNNRTTLHRSPSTRPCLDDVLHAREPRSGLHRSSTGTRDERIGRSLSSVTKCCVELAVQWRTCCCWGSGTSDENWKSARCVDVAHRWT